ncbi:uncharacterized protein LOC141673750 [Apium graveolens]|uniref:uncharacterized protein LOC141673750 n=1 Tax=Apium graveolens TaxID=4045 RepID=UPI003D7969E9
MWSKLWKLKVPSKVAHIFLRALTECLPTMTQLYSWYVPVQLTCPVCSTTEETIFHALVSTPFATQCWQRIVGGNPFGSTDNFKDWFSNILATFSSEKCGEVFMFCWAIWRARDNDRDGASRWARPHVNIIKVSVDASMFSKNNAYGIGLVARDSDGEVIHAQTWRIWGTLLVFVP